MKTRGRKPSDRYMPVVYFGVSLALLVTLLPTALRPPPQQPPTSAELNPDAPPDDQILLTELAQGKTATAGSGIGTDLGSLPGIGPGPGAKPRACPRGVGDPPRQTENIYAPPCAPAFVGDNGGVTSRGVTKNEIRIAVQGTGAGNQPQVDGPYPERPGANENAWDRTFRAFEKYFNENFQFYGRKVRFYVAKPSGSGIEAQRNAAVKGDQEYKVFGSGFTSEPQCDVYSQRKIVAFCAQNPKSFYAGRQPYLWGWYMNGNQLVDFTVEYLCKKLAGKNAIWAGDPLYQQSRRKFGFMLYDTRGYWELGDYLVQQAKQQCNEDVFLVGYNLDEAQGQGRLATAVTRFKAEGVTTIIPGMDWISNAAFTNTATNQGWFPEWFTSGGGALDRNQLAQFQDQRQWSHAFGITALDMERPNNTTDCWRAYHSIDPDAEPQYVFCTYVYGSLFALMSGIQQAGPNLSAETFRDGLFRLGYRFLTKPVWAIGGGYGPGDPTYTDNVAEIWWDPAAETPNDSSTGKVGAYRYVRGGQRYKLGEQPAEDPLVFKDGVVETPDNEIAG